MGHNHREKAMSEQQYTVNIYHTTTGELVNQMGPMSERKADKART